MSAIEMLDSFLEQKHCTLWGRGFDTVNPKSRRKAAEWLKNTIEEFYEFQIKDDTLDVGVEHLLAEHKAACVELAELRAEHKAMAELLKGILVEPYVDAYGDCAATGGTYGTEDPAALQRALGR